MAGIVVIFALLGVFTLIGSILGWIAATKANRLETAIQRLEQRTRKLELDINQPRPSAEAPGAAAAATISEPTSAPDPVPARARPPAPRPAAREPYTPPPLLRPPLPSLAERLIDNFQNNWMAWLGGISVALAGIFLVGYSIEMGYLGPTARIVLAVLAGLALHAGAEFFRRKTRSSQPAFAAMAGGASITLYAALLAALDLYHLTGPGLTFTLLAIVSLATMALATVHGPLLAALGLLGAYVVPILVVDNPADIRIYLVYSLVITTSSLFLIRFVYRPWLWLGTLAGALGWWLVSLGHIDADGFRGLYLAAFAYLALAIPTSDWLLKRVPEDRDPATETVLRAEGFSVQMILVTIAATALALAASILHLGFTGLGQALVLGVPLTLIVFRTARTHPALDVAPWLLLLTQLGAWFLAPDRSAADLLPTRIDLPLAREFLAFAFAMAALFGGGMWLSQRGRQWRHLHASLAWLSPVLWIALAYLRTTDLSTSWQWGAATLALGLLYIGAAGRRLQRDAGDSLAVWPMLGGHLAYSLAAAMFFREATLTLALSAQLISLAWLYRRFALGSLAWIMKAVLAVVVARLTFNPWVMTYPTDVHWSLWTYGGAVLCCFAASRLSDDTLPIRKWLEAATLHLLVLFLGAETRYWLYDGRIFVNQFTLTETAINTMIWGGLGLTYFNRALHSQHLARLYVACSRVLLVLALGSYALSLTFLNPLFGHEPISATRVFNILLPAYGAPVLIALAAWRFYETRFRNLAAAIGGGALFIFVTLEIRHLWHGALDLGLGSTNGEMYTYSAAWLAMAVITMLTATRFGLRKAYRAGSGLLLFVIGKIFIFDMAELEGLLRVASFMGLGLALLGLAWLYQRTSREVED
jgi:uncharacterized membrane protein